MNTDFLPGLLVLLSRFQWPKLRLCSAAVHVPGWYSWICCGVLQFWSYWSKWSVQHTSFHMCRGGNIYLMTAGIGHLMERNTLETPPKKILLWSHLWLRWVNRIWICLDFYLLFWQVVQSMFQQVTGCRWTAQHTCWLCYLALK
jgi:hypothetical protein